MILDRLLLRGVQYANRKLKSASLRLTRLTGKSPVRIHPHHLLEERAEHHWYLGYLEPDDSVLDVGCGNAQHTSSAAKHCCLAVGFDCDPVELRRGQVLLNGDGVANGHLLVASAVAPFPFVDASFDKVLLLDVLEHLVERDVALQEIRRVLRPDGQLLLSAPNKNTSWKRRLRAAALFSYSDPDHKIEYTRVSLIHELARHGFTIVGELMPIVYDTPLAGIIDLVGGLSLRAYRPLSQWKHDYAQAHPEESVGWRVVCRKTDYHE